MFMGHYAPAALGLQDRNGKCEIKLWHGFLAVQAIDFVFAILAILGVENSLLKDGAPVFYIPWSHSFLSAVLISLAAAIIFKTLKKSEWRSFCVIFGLAFSHWIFDLLVHRPDLPLYPLGEPVFGLGLWNYPWIAYGLEIGLLFCGFLYWVWVTNPKSQIFKFLPWGLFLFMSFLQFSAITLPGLRLAKGTLNTESYLQGATLGVASLTAFFTLAVLVGWIENGRYLKSSQSSST